MQHHLSQREETGSDLVRAGVHYRLELNRRFMPALRNMMPILSTGRGLIPDVRGFARHAADVAGDLSHAAYPAAQGVSVCFSMLM